MTKEDKEAELFEIFQNEIDLSQEEEDGEREEETDEDTGDGESSAGDDTVRKSKEEDENRTTAETEEENEETSSSTSSSAEQERSQEAPGGKSRNRSGSEFTGKTPSADTETKHIDEVSTGAGTTGEDDDNSMIVLTPNTSALLLAVVFVGFLGAYIIGYYAGTGGLIATEDRSAKTMEGEEGEDAADDSERQDNLSSFYSNRDREDASDSSSGNSSDTDASNSNEENNQQAAADKQVYTIFLISYDSSKDNDELKELISKNLDRLNRYDVAPTDVIEWNPNGKKEWAIVAGKIGSQERARKKKKNIEQKLRTIKRREGFSSYRADIIKVSSSKLDDISTD